MYNEYKQLINITCENSECYHNEKWAMIELKYVPIESVRCAKCDNNNINITLNNK